MILLLMVEMNLILGRPRGSRSNIPITYPVVYIRCYLFEFFKLQFYDCGIAMQFPQIQIWVINKASGCLKLRQIFV